MHFRIHWHLRALCLLCVTLLLSDCEKEELSPATYDGLGAKALSPIASITVDAESKYLTDRQKRQVVTYFNSTSSRKSEDSANRLEETVLRIIDNPATRLDVAEYGYMELS